MADFYLIGETKSVYNSDGYLSVYSYSDFPERFLNVDYVFIEIYGVYKKIFVEDSVFFNSELLIKFVNFNSDIDAEALVGKRIFVEKSGLVQLDDDVYFIHDLIGCKVFRKNKFFGLVVDVMQLTSHDVYVIELEGIRSLLPAVKEFISEIDTDLRKIELTNNAELLREDEN